jgi:transposase InsO family protein
VAVRYTERLAEAEVVASVGSVGDSYDNAMAEAFNSLFKAELVRKTGGWSRSWSPGCWGARWSGRGQPPAPGGMHWRGRLSEVSGWSLGHLGEPSPASAEDPDHTL